MFAFAAYEDVSLTSDTVITVGGIDLNVAGGAGAKIDSISVEASSMTVTMSPLAYLRVTSADRRTLSLSNAGSVKTTHSCTASVSDYLYENPASASAATITLTVDAGTCTTGGTSGGSGAPGGGGGGGGGSSVPGRAQKLYPDGTLVYLDEPGATAKIAELDAKFAVKSATAQAGVATPVAGITLAQVDSILALLRSFDAGDAIVANVRSSLTVGGVGATASPVASAAISGTIDRLLTKGMTNPGVKTLQQILNSDPDTRIAAAGVGSPGNESDFFGSATLKAVQKFQVKYDIAKPGDSGYGNVGPLTRTILNSFAGKPAASATVAPASVAAPSAAYTASSIGSISRTLSKGVTNADVKTLQRILNSDTETQVAASGTGAPGSETNFFGPGTLKAVQKFQVKYGLSGPGQEGYGNVGPKTRAKLNELGAKGGGSDQQIEDAMKQIKVLQEQLGQ